jgi:hypothetical protein
MARLLQMEFKRPATVRIKGLVTSEDEALTMFPALNIDQKVARKGLDILEQCL